MPEKVWTHDEILATLTEIVVECLAVEPEDVTPHANFFEDLGGESIDQIDLSFRCERAFGIKGPFRSLVDVSNTPLDSDGCLPIADWQRFLHQQPALKSAVEATGQTRFAPRELRQFFTIEVIAGFIDSALKQVPANPRS